MQLLAKLQLQLQLLVPGDFPVGWPLSVTHVPSLSQPRPCGTQSHGAAWKAALGGTGELVGVTSLL